METDFNELTGKTSHKITVTENTNFFTDVVLYTSGPVSLRKD